MVDFTVSEDTALAIDTAKRFADEQFLPQRRVARTKHALPALLLAQARDISDCTERIVRLPVKLRQYQVTQIERWQRLANLANVELQ